MMVKQRAYLLWWLCVPALAIAGYSYAKSHPPYLEWMSTGMLIYVLFFSVVVHEIAHGLAAQYCGDTTAHEAGRLTLNPMSHISPFGSVLVPLALYLLKAPAVLGWAKPVPFNPIRLKQHPRDQVFLSVAGPLSNFALSYLCFNLYVISGWMFNRWFPQSPISFSFDIFTPLALTSIPIESLEFVWFEMLRLGIVINIGLGVFNLIPFPPLDGSWLLKALVPKKAAVWIGKIQIAGFMLLVLALQFNLLQIFFYPAIILIFTFQYVANLCLR